MSWNTRRAVLADAGPLFAAVDASNQYHDLAQDEQRRRTELGFDVVVARSTLLEVQSLIVRRFGPALGLNWLESVLPGSVVVEPTVRDYAASVDRLRGFPDQSLTLFDAVLAVLSERRGLPVWTFDHHFDVMRVAVWG